MNFTQTFDFVSSAFAQICAERTQICIRSCLDVCTSALRVHFDFVLFSVYSSRHHATLNEVLPSAIANGPLQLRNATILVKNVHAWRRFMIFFSLWISPEHADVRDKHRTGEDGSLQRSMNSGVCRCCSQMPSTWPQCANFAESSNAKPAYTRMRDCRRLNQMWCKLQ